MEVKKESAAVTESNTTDTQTAGPQFKCFQKVEGSGACQPTIIGGITLDLQFKECKVDSEVTNCAHGCDSHYNTATKPLRRNTHIPQFPNNDKEYHHHLQCNGRMYFKTHLQNSQYQ